MNQISTEKIIIDASNGVVGRIASTAAKLALLGKEVIIVNCNYALFTGNRKNIITEYSSARRRGGSSLKGPHFPKHPERIMKRTIRGMLNYQQQRGLSAFKRILCYSETPAEYHNVPKMTFARSLSTTTMTLKEVSDRI